VRGGLWPGVLAVPRNFIRGFCFAAGGGTGIVRGAGAAVAAGSVRPVGSVEVTVGARAEWWPGMMVASARERLRAVRPLPVLAMRHAR